MGANCLASHGKVLLKQSSHTSVGDIYISFHKPVPFGHWLNSSLAKLTSYLHPLYKAQLQSMLSTARNASSEAPDPEQWEDVGPAWQSPVLVSLSGPRSCNKHLTPITAQWKLFSIVFGNDGMAETIVWQVFGYVQRFTKLVWLNRMWSSLIWLNLIQFHPVHSFDWI